MTEPQAASWKRCSTCKRDIPFGGPYFSCNVSTCNRRGTDFAFCSVACWDAHVPVLRHRESWAVEETAPTAEEWARRQRESAEREARTSQRPAGGGPPVPTPSPRAGDPPRDVLVVASKLKLYIRVVSGMNCSDGVVDVLSDRLRALCDQAIARARTAGRKTVMDRDFDDAG